MRQYATISADVVASTSLEQDDLGRLAKQIKETLGQFSKKYDGFWGRLVHGDSIECVMNNPNDALRVAVLLKAGVKSFVPSKSEDEEKDKEKRKAKEKFKRTGLRLAIGIGGMRIIDKDLDMMDGQAMYLSGRALASMRNKPIDNFQIEVASGVSYDKSISILAQHLSRRIDEATRRQCKTLFYRLQCNKDNDVAEKMDISRAGVNNNLSSIGWDLISKSVDFYEKFNFMQISDNQSNDNQSNDNQSNDDQSNDNQSNDDQSNDDQSNDGGITDNQSNGSQLFDNGTFDNQLNAHQMMTNQILDGWIADIQTPFIIEKVDSKQNASPFFCLSFFNRKKIFDLLLRGLDSKYLTFDDSLVLDRVRGNNLIFDLGRKYLVGKNQGDKEVVLPHFCDRPDACLRDFLMEENVFVGMTHHLSALSKVPYLYSQASVAHLRKRYHRKSGDKTRFFKMISSITPGLKVHPQNVDGNTIVIKTQRARAKWKVLQKKINTLGICDSRVLNKNIELVSFLQPYANSNLFVMVSYFEEKDYTIQNKPLTDIHMIFDILKENTDLSAKFMEKAKNMMSKGMKKSEDKIEKDTITKYEGKETVRLQPFNIKDMNTREKTKQFQDKSKDNGDLVVKVLEI